MIGVEGNDRIWGDDGDDLLIPGKGSNSLWGGAGLDTFFIRQQGVNTIFDFSLDDGDIVRLGSSRYSLIDTADGVLIYGRNLSITLVLGIFANDLVAGQNLKDPLTGSSAFLQESSYFDAIAGFAPVYRQDSLNTFDTLYTYDIKEIINVDKTLPYVFLGASFDQQATGQVKPAYRFFNQTSGTHFYTISEVESKYVKGLSNYTYEGVGFKAFDPGVATADFRRFYNSASGAHAFSAENADVEFFTSRGYTYEGIAWSAML